MYFWTDVEPIDSMISPSSSIVWAFVYYRANAVDAYWMSLEIVFRVVHTFHAVIDGIRVQAFRWLITISACGRMRSNRTRGSTFLSTAAIIASAILARY